MLSARPLLLFFHSTTPYKIINPKKHILTTDLDKKQNEMTKLLKIKEQLLSNIEIMKQITDIDHMLLELKEKEKDLEQEENIAKMNITQFT